MENRNYGISKKKKATIDDLKSQVLDAEYNVETYEAIVTSLTQKATRFNKYSDVANARAEEAKRNLSMIEEIVAKVKELSNDSNIVLSETSLSEKITKEMSGSMDSVIGKLIYSAEVIKKLQILLLRKKEFNPLISDELMELMAASVKDANNAVALSIVALKSSFIAQETIIESQDIVELQYKESLKLVSSLTGKSINEQDETPKMGSVYEQLKLNCKKANKVYKKSKKANSIVQKQLEEANSLLKKAQENLISLQQALAAATAAALAS